MGLKNILSFEELPKKVRQALLFGTGDDPVIMNYSDGERVYSTNKPFEGIIPNLDRRLRETDSAWLKEELGKYQSATYCGSCHGKRLKPEALAVKINDKDVSQLTSMSVASANIWFQELPQYLSKKERKIADRILREINERLNFLVKV